MPSGGGWSTAERCIMETKNLKGVCKGKFLYNDGSQEWDTEVKATKEDIKDMLETAMELSHKYEWAYQAVGDIYNDDRSKIGEYPRAEPTDVLGRIELEYAQRKWADQWEHLHGVSSVSSRFLDEHLHWEKIRRDCVKALRQYA